MVDQQNFKQLIKNSVAYLNSDEALQTVEADPYWPKWSSPWWHMLLLHEMNENALIPETMINAFVDSLSRIPLKIFPILPGDLPADVDPYRGTPCHCQLGNVYQVLAKRGVDVDQRLPWIRPWFLKYQMADGGLNCDNEAYLVQDEVPSSMVGTISAFEAILLYTPRVWTAEEENFLNRGAEFLINRKLILGSATKHNESERQSAKEWVKLCFPRFYSYDVLRGLNALLLWSQKTKKSLPKEAIQEAVSYLSNKFAKGPVQIGRLCYEGQTTILQNEKGEWLRRQPALYFPLLTAASEIGSVSPFLWQQWSNCLKMISENSEL